MGLHQALFKFVKCWRAPDVVGETVPSSWGLRRRTRACRVRDECAGAAGRSEDRGRIATALSASLMLSA